MAWAKLDSDVTSWIGGRDAEGLPFMTDDAFWNLLEGSLEGPERQLDWATYRAAKEQLWAVLEGESD